MDSRVSRCRGCIDVRLSHADLPSALAAAGRPGANDRIQLGFIGLGGRARWILTSEGLPGAEVVAAADCYLPRCHEAAKLVPGGDKWKTYQHYREMLEKEKLDAVFVETTTHARVLACVHVLQAGCDVYAEKPMTLTVAEGRYLVNAVQKYNRVLQTGSQQRSMPINQYASKLVREGAIGKIKTVITFNFLPGIGWTPRAPNPFPAGSTGTSGATRPSCAPTIATFSSAGEITLTTTPAASRGA